MLQTKTQTSLDFGHVVKVPSEYYHNQRAHQAIIQHAEVDEAFALAMMTEGRLLKLGLTEAHQKQLLLACAQHHSETILNILLESSELMDFAKRQGIFTQFVGLNLDRSLVHSRSAPSSTRTSLSPDARSVVRRTASVPNSPVRDGKELVAKMQGLRRAIINGVEQVYRHDEAQQKKLMAVFNYLWAVKPGDFEKICKEAQAIFEENGYEKVAETYREYMEALSSLNKQGLLCSLNFSKKESEFKEPDKEENKQFLQWYDKFKKARLEIDDFVQKELKLPKTIENFKEVVAQDWPSKVDQLNTLILKHLTTLKSNADAKEMMEQLLEANLRCAMINVQHIVEEQASKAESVAVSAPMM